MKKIYDEIFDYRERIQWRRCLVSYCWRWLFIKMYRFASTQIQINFSTISGFRFVLNYLFSKQDKVYDEIHEVFGDSDRRADQDDLKRLPYLDQVFKETLRRFTLLPLILRGVEEDSKIGKIFVCTNTRRVLDLRSDIELFLLLQEIVGYQLVPLF